MKILGRLFAICLLVGTIAAGVVYFNPTLRTRATVAALNLGIIKVKDADWGLLKLRSGAYGLDALRDLERHGTTDQIKMTAIAVERQWVEAGHVTPTGGGGPLQENFVQEKETRFADLILPLDAKTLPTDLVAGQHIPEGFWTTQRFHVGCLHAPLGGKSKRTAQCTLRMFDLTGDGQPEIVVDNIGSKTEDEGPESWESWQVYASRGEDWQTAARYDFCPIPQTAYAPAKAVDTVVDYVQLNDQPIDMFGGECFMPDNVTTTPAIETSKAKSNAGKIDQIPVLLPVAGHIPPSLIGSLKLGTVALTDVHWPHVGEESAWHPHYASLPPCFVAGDPKGCVAVVQDLNHDGVDDVIVVDLAFHPDGKDYRIATLLMIENGRWQVIANQAICATRDEDLRKAKVEVVPGAWKPAIFGGQMVAPKLSKDNCSFHMLMM